VASPAGGYDMLATDGTLCGHWSPQHSVLRRARSRRRRYLGVQMAAWRSRLGEWDRRLLVARAQRREIRTQQAERRAREHLQRLSLGIKDNLYGLNGR